MVFGGALYSGRGFFLFPFPLPFIPSPARRGLPKGAASVDAARKSNKRYMKTIV